MVLVLFNKNKLKFIKLTVAILEDEEYGFFCDETGLWKKTEHFSNFILTKIQESQKKVHINED